MTAGQCTWHAQEHLAPLSTPIATDLAAQSALSLDCHHWQPATHIESRSSTPGEPAQLSPQSIPMQKAAEIDLDRLPFWPRLRARIRLNIQSWLGQEQPPAPLVERSGVGAGTEPCFACHGRIANLGALAVESPDGDKQTLSVWRCRNCYTLFANDWIDRWERLDNLETEETFYRLAPAEARHLLAIILGAVGGEHPARRKERTSLRTQILQLLTALPVLSHQIRQGR